MKLVPVALCVLALVIGGPVRAATLHDFDFGNGKNGNFDFPFDFKSHHDKHSGDDDDRFRGDFGNYLANLHHDHDRYDKDKGDDGDKDGHGRKGKFYNIGDDRYYHHKGSCDPGDPGAEAPLPPALTLFAAGLMTLGMLGFLRARRERRGKAS